MTCSPKLDPFTMRVHEPQMGKRLKIMSVVEEYTREYLSLEGERSIKAGDVVDTRAARAAEKGEQHG